MRWLQQGIDKLIKMFPTNSNSIISKEMNITVSSITHKAYRIGLNKSDKYKYDVKSANNSRELNPAWKGGKTITPQGYILILKKGYLGADGSGHIFEHRYNMEQSIGRHLNKNEVVHHINKNKKDNRIENLQLMTIGEHTILHHTGAKMTEIARKNISIGAKNRRKKVISI